MKYTRAERLLLINKIASENEYVKLLKKYYPKIIEDMEDVFSFDEISRILQSCLKKFAQENLEYADKLNQVGAIFELLVPMENPELGFILKENMINCFAYKLASFKIDELANRDGFSKYRDKFDRYSLRVHDSSLDYYEDALANVRVCKDAVIKHMNSLSIDNEIVDNVCDLFEENCKKNIFSYSDIIIGHSDTFNNKDYLKDIAKYVIEK